MRRFVCLVLLFVVSVSLFAQNKRGPSTPEERARAVQIAQALEQTPMSKELRKDREWLTLWLIDVPDISIKICGMTLSWESKYKYSGELMAVQLASQAAYMIQKPEDAKNEVAVAQAGMESTLRAYSKILEADPKGHSKKMDEMAAIQSKGDLANYMKKNWPQSCEKN